MNPVNDLIHLWVCATILAILFIIFFVWLVLLQRRRQNEYFLEKKKLLFESERRELNARIEEREIMMTQISKEVHDNIGQIANIVRMHFHEIERLVKGEKLAAGHKILQYINAGGKFTDELVTSAHNISYSLNSDYIKKSGLIRIICEQLDQIASLGKIDRDLEITDDKTPIPAEQSLIIYRIAQEALNNIVKHSQASFIRVILIHRGSFLKMTIVDDGIGLTEKDLEKGRMGIGNMRQRAKILGGYLEIVGSPGYGSRVILTIEDLRYHGFK